MEDATLPKGVLGSLFKKNPSNLMGSKGNSCRHHDHPADINRHLIKRRLKLFRHSQNAEKRTSLCCIKLNHLEQRWVENPRETWIRMIEKVMAEVGKIWNEFKWLTQDRTESRNFRCAYASLRAGREEGCSCFGPILKI